MRIPAKFLAMSATALISLVGYEYYTAEAVIPVKGDRPTIGFGSTFKEDGTPVTMTDKIDPVRAIRLAGIHISREENICRNSIKDVPLSQGEYDLYCGDWLYQYGTGEWIRSDMRKELLAGRYVAACRALLQYRFVGKYDCSTMVDGKRNTRCWGVWTRQKERHAKCMALQ